MRVRVLISKKHPEYRLVLPLAAGMEGIAPHVRAAIERLGEWEERSQDELNESRPEHREAMEDIALQGAYLWMVSATYIGRVEVTASLPVQRQVQ